MTIQSLRMGALAAGMIIGASSMSPLAAELPILQEKDWLGYFVVSNTKSFQLGVASDGKTTLKVLNDKGTPMSTDLTIAVDFGVEETMPDGKKVIRRLIEGSLESEHPATMRPKNVTFKGKVTGEVGFEVFVTEDRGKVLLGGRLLDPSAVKNPTQFFLGVRIPTPKAAKNEGEKDEGNDRKKAKEEEDKAKGDKVQLVWTNGQKARILANKPVNGSSPEVSGPGITAASIELSSYQDKKILLTASPNSSMTLTNASEQPLSKGFTVRWTADPAKDPKGEARLAIDVK